MSGSVLPFRPSARTEAPPPEAAQVADSDACEWYEVQTPDADMLDVFYGLPESCRVWVRKVVHCFGKIQQAETRPRRPGA